MVIDHESVSSSKTHVENYSHIIMLEYGTCFVRYAFPVGRSSRIPVDNLEFNSSVNYHHQRTNKAEAHECDLDLLIKELAKKIDEIEFPLSE
nr:3665_t:CDS:2 [Entrophospora candida]